MKKIIVLDERMGSGYLTRGKIYDVEKAYVAFIGSVDDNSVEIPYDEATTEQKETLPLYIEFRDDRGVLEYTDANDEDESYIFFKDDKELAYYLIDNVEGLAESLVNIKRVLMD